MVSPIILSAKTIRNGFSLAFDLLITGLKAAVLMRSLRTCERAEERRLLYSICLAECTETLSFYHP